MSKVIEVARAVGGLLSVTTLLILFLGAFFYPSLEIDTKIFITLVIMISTLLGVDIALSEAPIEISVSRDKKYDDSTGDDDNGA